MLRARDQGGKVDLAWSSDRPYGKGAAHRTAGANHIEAEKDTLQTYLYKAGRSGYPLLQAYDVQRHFHSVFFRRPPSTLNEVL
jgi:hypothetical protein